MRDENRSIAFSRLCALYASNQPTREILDYLVRSHDHITLYYKLYLELVEPKFSSISGADLWMTLKLLSECGYGDFIIRVAVNRTKSSDVTRFVWRRPSFELSHEVIVPTKKRLLQLKQTEG